MRTGRRRDDARARASSACIAPRMHAHAQYNYVRTYARALAPLYERSYHLRAPPKAQILALSVHSASEAVESVPQALNAASVPCRRPSRRDRLRESHADTPYVCTAHRTWLESPGYGLRHSSPAARHQQHILCVLPACDALARRCAQHSSRRAAAAVHNALALDQYCLAIAVVAVVRPATLARTFA